MNEHVPMRAVLYTEDLEPITVLELPPRAAKLLEKYGRVHVPVLETISLLPMTTGPTMPMPRTVEIWAEKMRRRDNIHMMLFTRDEESALLLRSELLPGQRRDAQEEARRQFARGFLAGLFRAMP